MKKYITLFTLVLLINCTRENTTDNEFIEVKFRPKLEYHMTPMNGSRSSEVSIVGLFYQDDDLYGVLVPDNGEVTVQLQLGYTYQIIFMGNAENFIQNMEKLSTASIDLTFNDEEQFGNDIYISSKILLTPQADMDPISIELKRKVGIISFTPEDNPLPSNITEVKSIITNVGCSYKLSNGNINQEKITISAKANSNYSFKVYSFTTKNQSCDITSTIYYDDLYSRIWHLGSYTPIVNHEYCITGKLEKE